MNKEIWYFYADWCQFCQKQNPIIDEFEREHPDVEIIRINEADNKDAIEHNNVKGFPTLVLFKGDTSLGTREGLYSKEELEKIFA